MDEINLPKGFDSIEAFHKHVQNILKEDTNENLEQILETLVDNQQVKDYARKASKFLSGTNIVTKSILIAYALADNYTGPASILAYLHPNSIVTNQIIPKRREPWQQGNNIETPLARANEYSGIDISHNKKDNKTNISIFSSKEFTRDYIGPQGQHLKKMREKIESITGKNVKFMFITKRI